MSPAAGFEVLRFEAIAATAGVAVLELEGVLPGPAPRRPRLLVEARGRSVEVPAVTHGGEPWSATFAVDADAVADPRGAFGLVPDRGPVIALPSPSSAGGDEDRFVRMARAANELRHRASEHAAAAAGAHARLAEVAADRETLREDLRRAREALSAAERRIVEAESRAEAARAERETADASAAGRAATAERAAADRVAALEREAAEARERAAALERRAVEADDEVRASHRKLRDVRAQLEAAQRAQRAPVPARRGHALHEAEEPRDEAELHPVPDLREDAGSEDTTGSLEAQLAAPPEAPARTETLEVPQSDLAAPDPDGAVSIRRPKRTIRIGDDEGDAVLDPAAVGARHLEPATHGTQLWTPARIMVGAALLLLLLALVAIVLGFGIV